MQCNQAQAFSHHRVRASQPKICLVVVFWSEGYDLWLRALPIERIRVMVSLAGPPKDSAKKLMPAERHSVRWLVNLRWTPTSSACPGTEAASATNCC